MARETRKKRMGRVVKNSMDKTVIVAVEWRQRHPLYKKSIRRVTRFFVHDGENRCSLGDVVRIEETRPISRLKRWRVVQIVEQHEVAEVKPIELDQAVLAEVSEIEATAAPQDDGDLEDDGALDDVEDLEDDSASEDLEDDDALLFALLEQENQPVDDPITLESEGAGTAVDLEQDEGEGTEDEEKTQ